MLLNVRKYLLGFALFLFLLPMVAFASTEFKGTETVNINKANAAALSAYLKGIGPNKAKAVENYRKLNGSFKSTADIKNVPGIGEETYKAIKSKISTSRGVTIAPQGYKLGESSGKPKSTKKRLTRKKTTNSNSSSIAKKPRAKRVTESSSSSSSTPKKSKTKKPKLKRKTSTTSSSSSSSTSTSKKSAKKKKKIKKTKKKSS